MPILAGALFTVATCEAAGLILLRRLQLALDRAETLVFAFVSGSALVSLLVFLLCVTHQARLSVFLAIGVCLCGVGLRMPQSKIERQPLRISFLIYLLTVTAVFLVYLMNAIAPEISPDGSGYHLGNVVRLSENHGFVWDYFSMYSFFPQGMEMLFLLAYSIGGFPAAATVHLAFLCALGILLVCYGRRFEFPHAGIFGAILVFASPLLGIEGVSAYNDVALATCTFAVFYLIQVWDHEKSPNTLLIIGLLVGNCYALKYTGWIVLPFAAVALRGRGLSRLLPAAALVVLPWAVRNWLWVRNPVAPFLNSWFPNPFYSADSELTYLRLLRHVDGFRHWWEVPLDLTIYGAKLPGFLGPVFLLAPLALLALRYPQGRRLLTAAAVFSLPALLNPGARFLLSAIPFLALAMGLAVQNSPGTIPALAAFHCLLSFPAIMPVYCADWAWRIRTIPVRVALGLDPEGPFLQRFIPDYWLKAVIQENVPNNKKIFSFSTRPEAYLGRRVIVGYESAPGERASRLVLAKRPAELASLDIGFLLLNDSDPDTAEIRNNSRLYNLTLIEKRNETALYRID